jgi:hypothetical protein
MWRCCFWLSRRFGAGRLSFEPVGATIRGVKGRALLMTTAVGLVWAVTLPSAAAQRASKNATDTECRPAALHDFCRVGCPEPHAVETHHVEPSLAHVHAPAPSGIVIIEAGVDLSGKVVSACVMRSVRDDFDKAAQRAALASQWKIPAPRVPVRGYVLTLTACTPDRSSDCAHRAGK